MSSHFIGESKPVQDLLKLIKRVANSNTNILITGESGTGKELVAKLIHENSPIKNSPLVPVNCGAIPETLMESEFFGHKKGSFTGAVADKAGFFEVANGGTIFLDEVGELPLGMQVKLLRAIQEKVFNKVGGVEPVKVEVRIVAATNRDLAAEVRTGRFREDLYYRLNVIHIQTPPLRDRRDDIPILANYFLQKMMTSRSIQKVKAISSEALKVLSRYDWPGNVRELENVIERAATLENSTKITTKSLPHILTSRFGDLLESEEEGVPSEKIEKKGTKKEISVPAPNFSKGSVDLEAILGRVEKAYLLAALKEAQGVKKDAAKLLGITLRSFRYRSEKSGLE